MEVYSGFYGVPRGMVDLGTVVIHEQTGIVAPHCCEGCAERPRDNGIYRQKFSKFCGLKGETWAEHGEKTRNKKKKKGEKTGRKSQDR